MDSKWLLNTVYARTNNRKINKMENRLGAYRQSRDDLLTRIVIELSNDEHFVAAWLTGSYARNDADDVSDIDIHVVVGKPYSEILCARQAQVSPITTEERLELFRKFGEPALIHENNNNAPKDGTFTFVLYSGSALMIDWVLRPQMNTERPSQSVLLFDRGNIPVSAPAPEDVEESKKAVAEVWAFFWMMTAITIKYIVREDLVFVQEWLEILHGMVREIERRIERVPWQNAYVRGSLSKLQPTREKQIESLKQLCERMKELKPRVAEFTQSEPLMPIAEIETLFSLTKN
jgi:predicted nucleotidyltransferase